MSDTVETRLRAVEFVLAHLIAKTVDPIDIEAEISDLKSLATGGHAWRLFPEITRADAKNVVESAAELLEEALVQTGSGSKVP